MYIDINKLTPLQKYQYSYNLLAEGNYREGFKLFEYRWHPQAISSLPKPFIKLSPAPAWNGEDIYGKNVVVQMEMGYGDCIMWSRYLPILKALGARTVTLLQTKSLHNLMAQFACLDFITNNEKQFEVVQADFWIGSMSLSYMALNAPKYIQALFPTSSHYVVGREGYLDATPKILDGNVRVGINWKCSAGSHQHLRSLTSEDILYIKNNLPGVTFYSLCTGDDGPFNPLPSNDWKDDWNITAGYMNAMDYVISVDTSTVHLAGALGVPCLMLHPPDKYRCWRWATNNWYKSVKTFRQPHVDKVVRYLQHKVTK